MEDAPVLYAAQRFARRLNTAREAVRLCGADHSTNLRAVRIDATTIEAEGRKSGRRGEPKWASAGSDYCDSAGDIPLGLLLGPKRSALWAPQGEATAPAETEAKHQEPKQRAKNRGETTR